MADRVKKKRKRKENQKSARDHRVESWTTKSWVFFVCVTTSSEQVPNINDRGAGVEQPKSGLEWQERKKERKKERKNSVDECRPWELGLPDVEGKKKTEPKPTQSTATTSLPIRNRIKSLLPNRQKKRPEKEIANQTTPGTPNNLKKKKSLVMVTLRNNTMSEIKLGKTR